jgi:hypothetical protein
MVEKKVEKKRSRIIVPRGIADVPDIDEVFIADVRKPETKPAPESSAESSAELQKSERAEKSVTQSVKGKTKTKKRSEIVEPNWAIRRSDDNDSDNAGLNFDLQELFKSKPSKKGDKPPCSQGVAVGDQDMPDVGIAFPSFCWEMFTGHSVLPLSSCYALGGPTGAFKSHLSLEIARWVSGISGAIMFSENEVKYNPDMARAVMGRKRGEQVWVYKCKSFNQVQNTLIDGIKRRDAYNTVAPIMQIVDSVVGNATESSQKKVKDQGEVERGYPPNALAAANFLPNYMAMLSDKPYLGLWVTHSKDVKESMGPYEKVTTVLKGGGTWEYRCRMAFILKRVSENPKYEDTAWSVKLKLQFKKDAAVRTFQLPVTVRCGYDVLFDEAHNDFFNERKILFCWDEATVNLWLKPELAGYPAFYKSLVHDITGFTQVKVSGKNCYIAPQIGIGKNEATKDCTKIIDALYNSPGVLDKLRAEIGIQKGIGLRRGESFDDVMEQARAIAIRRAALMKSKNKVTYIRKANLKEYDKSAAE